MDYEEMLELSEDPNTDPEVLARVYGKAPRGYRIYLNLSSNPNTPLRILFEIGTIATLSRAGLPTIFKNIIENPSSPDYMEKYLNAKRYLRDTCNS